MKRRFALVISVLLIVCLAAAVPVFAKAKTYKYISDEVATKTLSKKTVMIKWKKHKVDKYIIYKTVYKKDGSSKEKKLKTVSGKKTSAVIKAGKNEYLSLHIKGINKKKKIEYHGYTICWTGLATPEWDDYEFAEGKCSPSYIKLEILGGGGMKPAGYQIYRKAKGAKSYKKIKTLKTGKYHVYWKDKSVKAGKAYYYKVRAFRKSGKKTWTSKMGESILRYAVHFNGKYQVSSEKDGDQMTVRLTADPHNGPTVFIRSELYYSLMPTEEEGVCYRISEYSLDGTVWEKTNDQYERIDTAAGESFWLRLTKDTYEEEYYEDLSPGMLTMSVSYRGVPCFLDINPDGNTAGTYLDSESIH